MLLELGPDKSPSGHFSIHEICTGGQFSVRSFAGPDNSLLMSLDTRINLCSYFIKVYLHLLNKRIIIADYIKMFHNFIFYFLYKFLKRRKFRAFFTFHY